MKILICCCRFRRRPPLPSSSSSGMRKLDGWMTGRMTGAASRSSGRVSVTNTQTDRHTHTTFALICRIGFGGLVSLLLLFCNGLHPLVSPIFKKKIYRFSDFDLVILIKLLLSTRWANFEEAFQQRHLNSFPLSRLVSIFRLGKGT